ncbi:aspartate aminotransferase family protein [Brevibacillus laterosporus]|uniref:aspartate aminotransferase family protein n=1 Tax=Brevibacillus laterosporus TaxID=1465 RepID=UPI002656E3AE|nr:aspartate aminotransferase family protein [Brevibacillus laterosporus]MDN9009125.1 aspartate aminotransferase family protein [Brevibacillus laterosporus]MDO0939894.1 aspartate aminotransferase family protein [Brevibacillus laterosporus]
MTVYTEKMHVMNTYARWDVTIVKGSGTTVWDHTGKAYLDCTSGIGVTSLGHCPPAVSAKLHQQLDTLWHSSNLTQHPLQEGLGKKLTELSGLDQVFFCNSGAEANEAAIKIARRYAQKTKNEDRFEIITFEQSFHGRTLATLTATGQQKVKEGFNPLPAGFITVPYGDVEAVKKVTTSQTCAVLLELVQGEGGVHPASTEFVTKLYEWCKSNDILLMIDEVQTGIGRTGEWFSYQHYGIVPDVITLAKGLGSGFPIGAMLATEAVAAVFSPGSHGTTFGGNQLAATAGMATLLEMEQQDILSHVKAMSEYLLDALKDITKQYPDQIKGVRGLGLMVGLEMTGEVSGYLKAAQQKGVLLLQAGPNVIRLLPALIIQKSEIDQLVLVLKEILQSGEK